MGEDVRWRQRFDNFERATTLLTEAMSVGVDSLSDLEREGTIHRFEFVLELAWKTMKDYLEAEGQEIIPATPRNVVKAAFVARIVPDGQVWIDMLDHRNLLSHTYNQDTFEQALIAVRDRYLPAIQQLRDWMSQR